MNYLTFTLLTLLSTTTAIPFHANNAYQRNWQTPTTPNPSLHASLSPSPTTPSPSSTPSSTLSALIYNWDNTCPKEKSKQCCTSIDKTGKEITQGLGELLPYVGGIQISSVLGLSCRKLSESDPSASCSESAMCCNGDKSGELFNTDCEMFDKAVKEKNEKKMKQLFASASPSVSSIVVSSPSPT